MINNLHDRCCTPATSLTVYQAAPPNKGSLVRDMIAALLLVLALALTVGGKIIDCLGRNNSTSLI